jgi:hypothetical protein
MPVWQLEPRRPYGRRSVFIGILLVILLVSSVAGAKVGMDLLFEWAVVAIPVFAGLAAWFATDEFLKEYRAKHRSPKYAEYALGHRSRSLPLSVLRRETLKSAPQ